MGLEQGAKQHTRLRAIRACDLQPARTVAMAGSAPRSSVFGGSCCCARSCPAGRGTKRPRCTPNHAPTHSVSQHPSAAVWLSRGGARRSLAMFHSELPSWRRRASRSGSWPGGRLRDPPTRPCHPPRPHQALHHDQLDAEGEVSCTSGPPGAQELATRPRRRKTADVTAVQWIRRLLSAHRPCLH
jgi:hypothetical protein